MRVLGILVAAELLLAVVGSSELNEGEQGPQSAQAPVINKETFRHELAHLRDRASTYVHDVKDLVKGLRGSVGLEDEEARIADVFAAGPELYNAAMGFSEGAIRHLWGEVKQHIEGAHDGFDEAPLACSALEQYISESAKEHPGQPLDKMVAFDLLVDDMDCMTGVLREIFQCAKNLDREGEMSIEDAVQYVKDLIFGLFKLRDSGLRFYLSVYHVFPEYLPLHEVSENNVPSKRGYLAEQLVNLLLRRESPPPPPPTGDGPPSPPPNGDGPPNPPPPSGNGGNRRRLSDLLNDLLKRENPPPPPPTGDGPPSPPPNGDGPPNPPPPSGNGGNRRRLSDLLNDLLKRENQPPPPTTGDGPPPPPPNGDGPPSPPPNGDGPPNPPPPSGNGGNRRRLSDLLNDLLKRENPPPPPPTGDGPPSPPPNGDGPPNPPPPSGNGGNRRRLSDLLNDLLKRENPPPPPTTGDGPSPPPPNGDGPPNPPPPTNNKNRRGLSLHFRNLLRNLLQ
ncbi:splicing factor 3A subunit 2-like [Haliotis rufescens]|uniref:splicing factor 3A subunit 2-like n=1 Tax=Haliotis rufescens TaxID=6454 RepID=UPI00201EEFC0|nr:splicing factor 3A subunit 2-like [Haliotis rufescens]